MATPWKDFGTAIITGCLALLGVLVTVGFRAIEGSRLRAGQAEMEERKTEHQADVAQTADLTARFKALMDGYESRIQDLTNEIISLRGEVRAIKQQSESHQSICRMCPYFDERVKNSNVRSTAARAT